MAVLTPLVVQRHNDLVAAQRATAFRRQQAADELLRIAAGGKVTRTTRGIAADLTAACQAEHLAWARYRNAFEAAA